MLLQCTVGESEEILKQLFASFKAQIRNVKVLSTEELCMVIFIYNKEGIYCVVLIIFEDFFKLFCFTNLEIFFSFMCQKPLWSNYIFMFLN